MEEEKNRYILSSRELDVINKVASVLSFGLSFKESLQNLLKVLYSFWDVRISFVAVYDRTLKKVRLLDTFGLEGDKLQISLGKGEGPIGKVFKSGVPVVLHETHLLDKRFTTNLEGTETFMAVPIRVSGDVVGVLGVFKTFGERESVEKGVELLLILGTMLGPVYRIEEKIQMERQEWEEERKECEKALEDSYSVEG